jgi:integrase
VLAYAARRGLIAGNRAERLKSSERPKPGTSRRRFISREEMVRLLESVPDRYCAAIACALFSGLRLSELLGLVWRDVDFVRGVLHVTHQLARDGSRKQLKTPAARRDVVLMSELAAVLRRHRLASPFSPDEELVFCSGRGRTVGHRNLTARGLEKAAWGGR